MDIVHVQMMATTRTEHRFYAYNSSGEDQQAINCEYNHSVKVWNAGVNDWELVNRDAPERGFDVDHENPGVFSSIIGSNLG